MQPATAEAEMSGARRVPSRRAPSQTSRHGPVVVATAQASTAVGDPCRRMVSRQRITSLQMGGWRAWTPQYKCRLYAGRLVSRMIRQLLGESSQTTVASATVSPTPSSTTAVTGNSIRLVTSGTVHRHSAVSVPRASSRTPRRGQSRSRGRWRGARRSWRVRSPLRRDW